MNQREVTKLKKYEITQKQLNEMGSAKRERIMGFIKQCKKNKVDHKQYNLANMGRYSIRSLNTKLFGKPKSNDTGFSIYDKSKETREKNRRIANVK